MGIVTTTIGIELLLRWGHFLAGITWIGLLYYFNFVQTEYFKEAEAAAKSDVTQKLVPRALWWFRWGAMFTLITGLGIFAVRGGGMSVDIYVGALLGIFMFLNVWLIIWPNQKTVIASAKQAAGGGEVLPEAASALAAAGLASRTNALFSIPMLFFMASSSHYPHSFKLLAFIIAVIIILVLEYNGAYPAIKNINVMKKLPAAGKMGPYASIQGVIYCGLGLTIVLFLLLELL
ncbi:Antitermination protein NusG [Candidatus Methylobacter favarea]|uniref:Antitermination protein NusG n=1 Tax=Candidatus Methylobacter favarea TaxID=2707345 RepID=A0A8S0WKK2_9GAMM|nr:urate hydroxylase PuuD [Candidatus Methylobacter favarea]CAA9892040.1 Antitermination protein NusG [Candidatus Methylobacter favarea]